MKIKKQIISTALIATIASSTILIQGPFLKAGSNPCYQLNSVSSTGTKSCQCWDDPVSGMGICPQGNYTDPGKICSGGKSSGWQECDNDLTTIGMKFSCSKSLNWANLLTCIGGGAGIGVIIGGPLGAGVGAGTAFVACLGCTVTTCSKQGKGISKTGTRAVYWGVSGCKKDNTGR